MVQWGLFQTLKLESVVAPNSLVVHLYGPVVAKHRDTEMLAISGLLDALQRFVIPYDHTLYINRDPVCPYRPCHQASF